MRARFARLRVGVALLLPLLPTVALCTTPHTAAALRTSHTSLAAPLVGPKAYYLSLGDSLAYGKQPNGDNTHGYSDDFAASLQATSPITLVDMGCPSETSTTFIDGGCPYANLAKYPYSGPQFSAALSFIQQHPGQVSPVTLDLGINDMKNLFNATTCTLASAQTIDQALSTYDANLSVIFAQLHAALDGTGDLVVMTNYFAHQNQCPTLLSLTETFNDHLAADAQQYGVLLAPVFDAFGGATTPNPTLCSYTWICSTYQDIHPTTEGYSVIAATFEQTLGYPALATPSPTAAPSSTPTTAPSATATDTPAPTDTPTPSATPTAVPRQVGAAPAVELSRFSGRYKDTLTITGTNFGATEPISLALVGASTVALSGTTSAADGSFVQTVTVPQASGGPYTLLAQGQSSQDGASAPFVIRPGAYLQNYQGATGTVDVLKGTGFAAHETVKGYWTSTSEPPFPITARTNGLGTFGGSASYPGITFTVPLSPTGRYSVYAVGQVSGRLALSTFTLTPHLHLTPSSGPAHSMVTVSGSGYGASESVLLLYDCGSSTCGSRTVLGTATAQPDGAFRMTVLIPAHTSLGAQSIGGLGLSSGAFAAATFTVQS